MTSQHQNSATSEARRPFTEPWLKRARQALFTVDGRLHLRSSLTAEETSSIKKWVTTIEARLAPGSDPRGLENAFLRLDAGYIDHRIDVNAARVRTEAYVFAIREMPIGR